MASGPITPWQIEGEKVEAVTDFLFLGSKFTADGDSSHEIRRWLPLGRKAMTSLDKWVKKQRHHFANKGPYSQGYGLSSSHVWLWELGHKESRALKYLSLLTVVLEKTLKSPVDSKVIKSVSLKGNQPWKFIGRTDAEAEAPDLWPPDVNSWLIGKDPDAGKDWMQKKRAAENAIVGRNHWLNGHEFEQTPGDSGG